MDYATLSANDVGKTPNNNFPKQDRYPAHIPLLSELVDSVEAFAAARHISDPTVGYCDDYNEILRISKLVGNSVISDFPMQWLSAHNDKNQKN